MEKTLKQIATELIERAKPKGNITAAEVMEALDDTDSSMEALEKTFEALESNGIEVTHDIDSSAFEMPDEDFEDTIDDNPEEVEVLLAQEGVAVDDPV